MLGSSKDIEARLQEYVTTRGMRLEQRLGFGRDGSVFATSDGTAVKGFGDREAFVRELVVYGRLQQHRVSKVLIHHVPQLLGSDESLVVIEMSIVTRPFLLDFAGAYLDRAADFSPEVMEDWREDKLEQFGERWPEVEAVLDLLRLRYGIYLLDVHPGNITFADD